ncbi:MAG: outer membrane protein assembly factor [Gammaproteobacteria bacterium]|nr:outer membrane protein assembly factor [Gammaproteobacteria bacterium]
MHVDTRRSRAGSYRRVRALLLMLAVSAVRAAGAGVEIDLVGLEGRLRDNVLAQLSINRQHDAANVTAARVEALHRRAPAEIRRGLEALGHYEPQIDATLTQTASGWLARYVVTPGPAVHVRSVDIRIDGEAHDDAAFAAAKAGFPLRPGDVLDHGAYARGKQAFVRLAAERGYFDGHFVASEVRVDLADHAATVVVHYDSGARYRFGEIRLPATVLRPDFLNHYVPFAAGDPYSADALLDLEAALTNSDYFASVEVSPRRDQGLAGAVPVEVQLEPRKPHKYALGAGFGTDTGPRARATWDMRYLNDRGHHVGADLRVSPVISSISGRYTIPIRDPRRDEFAFTSSLLRENTDASDSSKFQVGAARLTTRYGWRETLSLDYLLEDFDVSGEGETSGLLVPGVRWNRIWSDDPIYTSAGRRLGLSLSGAHTALLSAVSFARLQLDGKFIQALGDAARLIARAEIGATVVSDFDRLPATQRFFAGGDNSVRGFDFRSLGPHDDAGAVVGGRYLAVGSVEIERRVYRNWSAALFTDFGNAFNRPAQLADVVAYSVGAGVRWLTPIGLLRVDVAAGVSEPDPPIRLHIVVGPDL